MSLIEMPVCSHSVPVRLPCKSCGRIGKPLIKDEIINHDESVLKLNKKINKLEKDIKKLTKFFKDIHEEFEDFKGGTNRDLFKCVDEYAQLKENMFSIQADINFIRGIEQSFDRALSDFRYSTDEAQRTVRNRDDVINSLCQKISVIERQIKG